MGTGGQTGHSERTSEGRNARKGTDLRVLFRGQGRKEGRERETEDLTVGLTETGLVASSCNEKGRYVGCALFRDRGLVIRRGLTGNTGVCPGSHTTERRVAAKEKPRNKRVREFGGL